MRSSIVILACLLLAADSIASRQRTMTVNGAIVVEGAKREADLANVAVWLSADHDGLPAHAGDVPRRARMLQKDKRFTPQILVIRVGSEVDFPNADPFFHNVFSMFDGKRFDLGLYEAGSSRSVRFTKPGISFVFCNIHPEMNAVIVAVDTPHAALTNAGGTFAIPDIAPGRYRISVWHPRYTAAAGEGFPREVTVSEGRPDLGVIRLVDSGKPMPQHKNKYGRDYNPPAPPSPVYKK